ncbi:MAG: hypothetical protein IJ272_04100 [Clostridia bacterium]|nr:hypothetical protein [Clostridia bacterium]
MIKSSKSGITLASLVIYIVLFTTFTVFVSGISSNMNERLFDSRGEAINYSSLNKLQYNLEDSALNSKDVVITSNGISYSNGDIYVYDETQKVIYKNDGILCLNVENFTTSIETGINTKKVTINISFNKYLNTITKQVISCVEGA